MAKIKKAMKGGSKVAGGKKGKKPPESDQVRTGVPSARLRRHGGPSWVVAEAFPYTRARAVGREVLAAC